MIENLKIKFNHNVFKPTGTSELLISSIKKNEKITPKIIDNTALDVRKITTSDSNKKKLIVLVL